MGKKRKFQIGSGKKNLSRDKIQHITYSVLGSASWILVLAFVLLFGIYGTKKAYNFGYQVFSNDITAKNGDNVQVTIEESAGALQVGKALKKQGLIQDEYVFYVQSKLFELEVVPGTYTINTSMTSREMLEVFHKGEEQNDT